MKALTNKQKLIIAGGVTAIALIYLYRKILKNKISEKLMNMVKMNPLRIKFLEKFQILINEYNT
jgi:hypothetical protein